jgi:hypothetical protein
MRLLFARLWRYLFPPRRRAVAGASPGPATMAVPITTAVVAASVSQAAAGAPSAMGPVSAPASASHAPTTGV